MIEFRNVAVSFGELLVVRDVSLRMERGRTTVLLGRSGCGKTTLLRLINRMLLPTRGEVVVDGRATAEWDPIRLRRKTGYMIQEGGLLPHYTVERNVSLVPELERWDREAIRARTDALLELVGLPPDEFRDRFPHQLSGGQRQRVGVARALAADPPLLLCDEPFAALDPITRTQLQKEFRRLAAQLGKTIVFVTHDVREALYLASTIVLIAGGTVAVAADAQEFARRDHPEARAFVASLELEADVAP